jgi:hypothetical protein
MARGKENFVKKAHSLLQAYAETCNIVEACKKAKVGRDCHYRWIKKYPKYAAAFEKTREWAAEYLESEAVDRASKGWLEPVHYQGKVCGHVRRFDGGLMQFLLRGMMPEKYGVQRQEISGPEGAPVQAVIEVRFVRPGDVPGSDQQA